MQSHQFDARSCDGDGCDDESECRNRQPWSPSKDAPMEDKEKPWHSYDTVFLNAKAGMDEVDKEKVQKVVYEMSKGSRYFENEKRKEAIVKQRIERLKSQAALMTAAELTSLEKAVDKKIEELEAGRDLSRVWIHVDLDAFYAAVETQENISLVGKPMAVGSISMICTANYEARKFGVRAAMPGFIARKLCPHLIFVSPDFEKYSKYSELTRQVFKEYDERFIARSMDEAYLDVTNLCIERKMSGTQVAEEIRFHVNEKTKLTCSAGVGPNRLLAKVCSEINKPNGQYVLPNDRSTIMNFISALPIRKVSGVGKVTERMLKEVLGVSSCGEFLQKRYMIAALFSPISRDFFFSVGLGIGGSEPPQDELRKSLSNERTFVATSNETFFARKLEELAEALAVDMAKEGLQGRTLTLKLKTASFEVRTRAVTLQQYISSKSDILLHGSKLLKAELPLSLRLMGLRIGNFKGEAFGCLRPSQRTLSGYLNQNASSPCKHADTADNCEYEVMNSTSKSELSTPNLTEQEHSASFHNNCVDRRSSASYEMDDLKNLSYQHGNEQTVTFERLNQDSSTSEVLRQPVLEQEEFFLAGEEASVISQHNNDGSCGPHSEKWCVFSENTERLFRRNSSVNDKPTLPKPKLTELLETSGSFTWIEDFRCSVCGMEVPAEFLPSRQEHEDYHLAQLLQEQDGGIGLWSNNTDYFKREIRKRCLKEESGSGRKLPKKDANCLPIDAYFIKSRHSP